MDAAANGSNMLTDEDGIAIRIDQHEACGTGAVLIRLGRQRKAFCFELALVLADVGELRDRLRVFVPAGVEGQGVALEHALKQPHGYASVAQDQPVLRGYAEDRDEAQL